MICAPALGIISTLKAERRRKAVAPVTSPSFIRKVNIFPEGFLFPVYFCFYLIGQNCVTLTPLASREAGKATHFISQPVLMERGQGREKGLAMKT